MSTLTEVRVPDLGDFKDVEIVDVLVKAGDVVALETPLITLETDKATMDVPSTAAGVIKSVEAKKGERIAKGGLIVTVEVWGDSAVEKKPRPKAAAADVSPAKSEAPPPKNDVSAAKTDPKGPPKSEKKAGEKTAADAERVSHDVTVPDIGDFKDVEVVDVLVKVGDTIAVDTPMITMETDKATMDVPSPAAGVVTSIAVKKGDRVAKGRVILTLQSAGEVKPEAASAVEENPASKPSVPPAAAATPAPAAPPLSQPKAAAAAAPAVIDESGFSRAFAGPSVRKLARELGVDLARVKGTGIKNRVTHDDVKSWVKQALTGRSPAIASGVVGGGLPKVPEVDFAKYGEVELKPLTRIQKISGPRLHASWVNLPHVTQFDEADITDLEATRVSLKDEAQQRGIKLTPLAFVLRACVLALHEMPLLNTSLDASGQNLVYKKYIHLGFAADTPNGLVVPVIRDADRKDVYELAKDLAALSAKARDGKLGPAEMQGGSFTISSLGGIGGTAFTPIINAPEVAILGVSKSAVRPVYIDKQFVPRLLLPLSLSYDHRVIDGAAAVRFTTLLAQKLADAKGLLEAVP
jgi:pyruvate dehydrogenase E2 component (dihydrolipoamide acetyltransferase)